MSANISQDLHLKLLFPIELTDPVLDRVKDLVVKTWSENEVQRSGKYLLVRLFNLPVDRIVEIREEIWSSAQHILTHGQDGDLLSTLLDRHPKLQGHPRFSSVLSAFDNLARIIAEVEGSSRHVTLASPEGIGDDNTNALQARADFRKKATEQPRVNIPDTKPVKPDIPEVYREEGKHRDGQVFTS